MPGVAGSVRPVHARLATIADAEAIRTIYNVEVEGSTATFDLVPRSLADQVAWQEARSGAHVVIVVEDSGPGVAAGVAAGMPTLGVCRVPGTEASLAQADRVVHEVTAEAILALLL